MAFDPFISGQLDSLARYSLNPDEELNRVRAETVHNWARPKRVVDAKKDADGDTVVLEDVETGVRETVRYPRGLDTAESVIRPGADISDPKYRRQAEHIARMRGVNVDDVTLADVKEEGLKAKRANLSLLGGEGSLVYTVDSKEEGLFGRQLDDIILPTGELVSRELNTPEFNTSWSSPYNRKERVRKERQLLNDLQRFVGKGNFTGGVNPDTGEPEPQFDPQSGTLYYNGRGGFDEKSLEQAFPLLQAEANLKNAWAKHGGLIGSSVNAVARVWDSIDQYFTDIIGKNSLYFLDLAPEERDKRLEEIIKNRTKRGYKVNQLKDRAIDIEVLRKIEKDGYGAAALYALQDLPNFGARMLNSAAHIAAYSLTGPFAALNLLGLTAAYNIDNNLEYLKEHGSRAEGNAKAAILGWSAVEALSELVGYRYITRGLPLGVKDLARMIVSTPIGRSATRLIGGTLESLGVEGLSGFLAEFSSEMAVQQDISKIDRPQIALGTIQEAYGGLAAKQVATVGGGVKEGLGRAVGGATPAQVNEEFKKARLYERLLKNKNISEERRTTLENKLAASRERIQELHFRAGQRNNVAVQDRIELLGEKFFPDLDFSYNEFQKPENVGKVDEKTAAKAVVDFAQAIAKTQPIATPPKEKMKYARQAIVAFRRFSVFNNQLKEKIDKLEAKETLTDKEQKALDAAKKVYEGSQNTVNEARIKLRDLAEQVEEYRQAIDEAEKITKLFSITVDPDAEETGSSSTSGITSKEGKKAAEAIRKVTAKLSELRRKVAKRQPDKDISQVSIEVTEGTPEQPGARQYYEGAKAGEMLDDKGDTTPKYQAWKNFLSWINNKSEAIQDAYVKAQAAGPGVAYYVAKRFEPGGEFPVLSSLPEGMSKEEAEEKYWTIHADSTQLADVTKAEADYLNQVDEAITSLLEVQRKLKNFGLTTEEGSQEISELVRALRATLEDVGDISDLGRPTSKGKKGEKKGSTDRKVKTETKEERDKREEKQRKEAKGTFFEDMLERAGELGGQILGFREGSNQFLRPLTTVADVFKFRKFGKKEGDAIRSILDAMVDDLEKPWSLGDKNAATLSAEFLKKVTEGKDFTKEQIKNTKNQIISIMEVFVDLRNALNDNPQLLANIEAMDRGGGLWPRISANMFQVYDGEGNAHLPDKLVLLMAVEMVAWTRVNARRSLNRTKEEIAEFIFGDKDAVVSNELYKTLRNVGFTRSYAARELGIGVVRALGKVKKRPDDPFYEMDFNQADLETSMGTLMIHLFSNVSMPSLGNIKILERESASFELKKEDDMKPQYVESAPGRTDQRTIDYVRITPNESNRSEPDKNIVKLLDTFSKKGAMPADRLFKTFTGRQSEVSGYYTEEVEGTPRRSRNSIFNLPKKVVDRMKKMQKTPHIALTTPFEMFMALGDNAREDLFDIQETNHTSQDVKDNRQAAYDAKRQEIQAAIDFYNSGLVDDASSIFFRMGVQRTGRLFYRSNDINMQNSKLHRYLFMVKDHKKEYDPNNKKDLQDYQMGVAQLFGFDVDKTDMASVLEGYNKIIADPLVRRAIEQFKADNKEAFQKTVLQLHERYKSGYAILPGLAALDAFNAKEKFNVSIPFQADSITSGFAISNLQIFGEEIKDLLAKLSKLGVLPDGEKKKFEEIIKDANFDDAYQTIARAAGNAIEDIKSQGDEKTKKRYAALESIHGAFFERENKTVLTKFARAIAKPAFMIFNYGAGMQKILTEMSEEALDKLYDQIEEFYRDKASGEWKDDETQANAKQLADSLNALLNYADDSKKRFTAEKLVNVKQGAEFSLTEQQQETIKRTVFQLYKKPFEESMENFVGPMREIRNGLVQAMEMGFMAYDILLEEEIGNVKESLGSKRTVGTSQFHINKAMENLKERGITFSIPSFDYTDEDGNEGKIDLNKSTTIGERSKGVETKVGEGESYDQVVYRTGKKRQKKRNKKRSAKSIEARPGLRFPSIPGMAVLVRAIQNIDSSIVGEALDAVGLAAVTLYDAVISDPRSVRELVDNMNKRYAQSGEITESGEARHSIVNEYLDTFTNIINELTPEQRSRVEERYSRESQEAKDKKRASKKKEVTTETINDKQDFLEGEKQRSDKKRKELWNVFNRAGKNVVRQFRNVFVPDYEDDVEPARRGPKVRRKASYSFDDATDSIISGMVRRAESVTDFLTEFLNRRKRPEWIQEEDWENLKGSRIDALTYALDLHALSGPTDVYSKDLVVWALTRVMTRDATISEDNIEDIIDDISSFSGLASQALLKNAEIAIAYNMMATKNKIPALTLMKDMAELLLQALAVIRVPDSNLYHSIDPDVEATIENVYQSNNLAETSMNVFEMLDKLNDLIAEGDTKELEHRANLRFLMRNLIFPHIQKVQDTVIEVNSTDIYSFGDVVLDGEGRPIKMTINYNKTPIAYAQQSGLEVLAHEHVHSIVHSALLSNDTYRRTVEALYKATRQYITPDSFLSRDSNGNIIYLQDVATEKRMAKLQYNSIYSKGAEPDIRHLSEFIAYGLTNKHLVPLLKATTIKLPSRFSSKWYTGENFFQNILALFRGAIEVLGNLASGRSTIRKTNAYEILFNHTANVLETNEARRKEINSRTPHSSFNYYRRKMDDGFSKFLKRSVETAAQRAVFEESEGRYVTRNPDTVLGRVLFMLGIPFSRAAEVLKEDKKIHFLAYKLYENTIKRSKIATELTKTLTYAFGRRETPRMIQALQQMKRDVEQGRFHVKEFYQDRLRMAFGENREHVTKDISAALTRIIVSADFSAIYGASRYSQKEAFDLLFSRSKRATEIDALKKKMGITAGSYLDIQSSQLAKSMIQGKVDYGMIYGNAHLIVKNAPQGSAQNINVEDLDIYISLLALNELHPSVIQSIAPLHKMEMARNSQDNGITHLIRNAQAYKEERLEKEKEGNPLMMEKGETARIKSEFASMKIRTSETDRELQRENFTKFHEILPVPGVINKSIELYVNPGRPSRGYIQGAMSMTNEHPDGISILPLIKNTVPTGMVMTEFNKFVAREKKKTESGRQSAVTFKPVVNSDGKVVDMVYRIPNNDFAHALRQDFDVFQVLPTMWMGTYDRITSNQVNRDTVDAMVDHAQKNIEKKPRWFINIYDDEYKRDYYDKLSAETRKYIDKKAIKIKKDGKSKREFYVDERFLDFLFGYKEPTITDFGVFKLFPAFTRFSRKVEAAWMDTVDLGKLTSVVKLPQVNTVNMTSNFVTSSIYGAPFSYVIKHWDEGIRSLEEYIKDSRALRDIDYEIRLNPALKNDTATQRKRNRIIEKININSVTPLIDAGFYNSIVEDVNMDNERFRLEFFKNAQKKLREAKEKNVVLGTAASYTWLTQETQYFQESAKMLRFSDFIARYALYKNLTEEQGKSKDTALRVVHDAFVNYNIPIPRVLHYGDSIGLTLFVKYWIQIQRAIVRMFVDRPVSSLSYLMLKKFTGLPIHSISDSSIFLGHLPMNMAMDDVLGSVIEPPGSQLIREAL